MFPVSCLDVYRLDVYRLGVYLLENGERFYCGFYCGRNLMKFIYTGILLRQFYKVIRNLGIRNLGYPASSSSPPELPSSDFVHRKYR